MSRDGAGTYSLPAGNPVVTGTAISSTWANTAFNDFATQFNNVLTKDSVVAPTAPIRFPLGAVGAPSITFSGDLNTGMWSPAADTMAWSTAGAEQMRLASNSLRLGTTSSALDGITLSPSFSIGWDESSNSAIATSFRQTSSAGHIIGSGVKWSANANAFASSRTASWGHSAIKVGYEVISFYVNAAASVAIGTDVTMVERMQINAAGNVGIGTTPSSTDRLYVRGAGTTSATYCFSAVTSLGTLLSVRDDGYINTGTQANSPYNLTTATDANMVVDSGGAVYRSVSSIKYKDNVRNYTRGIESVLALRPVFYKSKGGGDIRRATEKELDKLPKEVVDGKEVKPTKLPNGHVLPVGPDHAGFIAEEVHATGMTEFVQYADDGTPDALSYGHMTALLCKAIQEQQALIVALTARVAALE